MNVDILFSDTVNLSAEEKISLSNWPIMLSQINSRIDNGFEIHSIMINGFSYKGGKRENGILVVLASVDYTPPRGNRTSYNVTFISDATVLLVVIRILRGEASPAEEAAYDHQVILVQQSRWGRNDPDCLEIPGGLIWDNGTIDLGQIRSPAIEALREFSEETATGNQSDFSLQVNTGEIKSLGKPVSIYPCVTDQQHQFFVEIDMNSFQFEDLKLSLEGRKGGIAKEGESTHVRIISLDAAYERLLEKGTAPDAFQALARYKRHLEQSRKFIDRPRSF